jgi:hypothetical protein
LPDGVTVAQGILVPFVQVRILVGHFAHKTRRHMGTADFAAEIVSPTEAAFMKAYSKSVQQHMELFVAVGLLMDENGLGVSEITLASLLAVELLDEHDLFETQLAAVVERGSFRARETENDAIRRVRAMLQIVRNSFYRALRINPETKEPVATGWCSGCPGLMEAHVNAPASPGVLADLTSCLENVFGVNGVQVILAQIQNVALPESDVEEEEHEDDNDDENWADKWSSD